MKVTTEFVMIVFIAVMFFYSQGAFAGYLRCSDGRLVGEGASISEVQGCNLNNAYRVKNYRADIVTARDAYKQEVVVIDGKVNSIGR